MDTFLATPDKVTDELDQLVWALVESPREEPGNSRYQVVLAKYPKLFKHTTRPPYYVTPQSENQELGTRSGWVGNTNNTKDDAQRSTSS